ncbi:MAG TPA: bifunctional DNA-formamidopyrimidine glycosylase/DNA-(apurinic or apyrimidinic site) lyase [Ktedonobacteraceae bacterium]
MPELPEVEYTARQLRNAIIGATIHEALVFWQRTIGHPDLPDFLAEIADRNILGVRRRGKFLVVDLSGELVLTIHRRMTGNLLLLPPGWEIDTSLQTSDPTAWNIKGPFIHKYSTGDAESTINGNPSDLLYCRVCFNLADGRRLLFTDPRKFGRIELWPSEREQEALKGLGPEPLSDDFTIEILARGLSGRKGAIKQVLLNQEVIAGLGNIYADETLYYASIHPLRPANSLIPAEIQQLHEGIVSVLTLGIEHGGTSFSEYRDLWGEAGDNYNHVRVYHQQGKPCSRCGTPIERIVVGQRSTHFCPTCQKPTSA